MIDCPLTHAGVISVQTRLLVNAEWSENEATWVQRQSCEVILIPFNVVWMLQQVKFFSFICLSFCLGDVGRIYSLLLFYIIIGQQSASGQNKNRWIHPKPTLCSLCRLNWSCVTSLFFIFLIITQFKYLSWPIMLFLFFFFAWKLPLFALCIKMRFRQSNKKYAFTVF